jgi:hypothetical protein
VRLTPLFVFDQFIPLLYHFRRKEPQVANGNPPLWRSDLPVTKEAAYGKWSSSEATVLPVKKTTVEIGQWNPDAKDVGCETMRKESRMHCSPAYGDGIPGGVQAGKPTKKNWPRKISLRHPDHSGIRATLP